VLLGGERHGKLIEGFDLGNSPLEYTPEKVRGRTIAFTTTNGTRALLHAKAALHVLIGCLNNQDAVAAAAYQLASSECSDVHLLCAGTGGVMCLDDILAAGAIAESIRQLGPTTLADSAMLAIRAFHDAAASGLEAAMNDALGGRNLVEIGMVADVVECSRVNIRPFVPVFDTGAGEIRL
jgi:2-phosphosulfolactate phosphatase